MKAMTSADNTELGTLLDLQDLSHLRLAAVCLSVSEI